MTNNLRAICENCGYELGWHHDGDDEFPVNFCPPRPGTDWGKAIGIDWDKAPGTVFSPAKCEWCGKTPAEKYSYYEGDTHLYDRFICEDCADMEEREIDI